MEIWRPSIDWRKEMRTLEAKAREEKVSPACATTGATLQNMSALASPPSESCSSIVSLEFLPRPRTIDTLHFLSHK